MHNTGNSSSLFSLFLPSRQLLHPQDGPQGCVKMATKKPRGEALSSPAGDRQPSFQRPVSTTPPNNGAILSPPGLDSSSAPNGLDPRRPLDRGAKMLLGWSHCSPLESRFIGFPLLTATLRSTYSFKVLLGVGPTFSGPKHWGALNSDKTLCDKHDISLSSAIPHGAFLEGHRSQDTS